MGSDFGLCFFMAEDKALFYPFAQGLLLYG
jgi:hypothetical protein